MGRLFAANTYVLGGQISRPSLAELQKIGLVDINGRLSKDAFRDDKTLVEMILPAGVITMESGEYYGAGAFAGCSFLRKITLPNTLVAIQHSAFHGCCRLQEILFPTMVTTIGDHAFFGCHSLQEITLPTTVTAIGDRAFRGCSSLCTVALPNTLTAICDGVFDGCSGLLEIVFPNMLTTIAGRAFEGCTSLHTIVLPNTLVTIMDWAFYGCSGLHQVDLPDTLTTIGDGIFGGCTNLWEIALPVTLTAIGEHAFYACSNLRSLAFPPSLVFMAPDAFEGCTNLQTDIPTMSVWTPSLAELQAAGKVDESGLLKGGAFRRNTILTRVVLPIGVTSIEDGGSGEGAFSDSSNLREIVLPNTLTAIGANAFSYCWKLRLIALPTSLTAIGAGAFHGCSRLQTLLILAPATGTSAPAHGTNLPSAANHPNACTVWNTLFGWEEIPTILRVHAPDHIVMQLGGRFQEYTHLTEVPQAMQVAPHAASLAAVELWLWWSPPQPGGPSAYYNHFRPTRARNHIVWTVMAIVARLECTETFPYLPFELWNMMLGFLKHGALPTLDDNGWLPGPISALHASH
jgi:hypothetical protein